VEEPVGRTTSRALPKQTRLAKRSEFLKVYETGRKYFSKYCVLFVLGNGLTYSRIGITATRKLGKANVRNRFKRWIRETYRHQSGPLGLDQKAVDFVVNLKPSAADATFRDFSRDLTALLRRAATADR
jgi:ribonuclease P protein component